MNDLPAPFYDSIEAYQEVIMEPTPEQKIQEAKDNFRRQLTWAYIFLFMPVWFGFVAFAVFSFNMSKLELLSLGTATGLFLSCFKDMWQFIWRKG